MDVTCGVQTSCPITTELERHAVEVFLRQMWFEYPANRITVIDALVLCDGMEVGPYDFEQIIERVFAAQSVDPEDAAVEAFKVHHLRLKAMGARRC